VNADSKQGAGQLAHGEGRFQLPPAIVALFLFVCLLDRVNHAKPFLPAQGLAALVVLMGLWAAVASAVPHLAWLNAVFAASLAVFIGGILESLSAVIGVPFSRRNYLPGAGPTLLGLVPWWLPLGWAILALTARGTARLIFYRFQRHAFHGYRVIGVATLLALAGSIGLEFFCTRSLPLWTATELSFWSFAGMCFVHLLIQISITPLMIDKFPGRRPPNLLPFWVWGAVNVLLVTGILGGR